ncbi:MAG: hypothetical protein EP340_07300 [Alphaproteobacteria bacterium]|nr:MAG: hypothetical protein EP340_07300 [Alphaproteobacteria bacterium]
MTLKRTIGGLMVLGLCSAAPALAGEEAFDGYQKTGEVKSCIDLSDIRTTRVLDGSHILFKMNGKRLYLNTLPRECPSLNFHKSFSYKVHGSTLCSSDTISVLTGGAVPGSTCGLGSFEEVEKEKSSSSE